MFIFLLERNNRIGVKRYFQTLTDLKKYYKIKKLVKNGKGCAINSRGTKIEWIEYMAERNNRIKEEEENDK